MAQRLVTFIVNDEEGSGVDVPEIEGWREQIGTGKADIYFDEPFGDESTDEPYPEEDWRYEVGNGDTRLGYGEWRRHQIEAAEHDAADAAAPPACPSIPDLVGNPLWDDAEALVRPDGTIEPGYEGAAAFMLAQLVEQRRRSENGQEAEGAAPNDPTTAQGGPHAGFDLAEVGSVYVDSLDRYVVSLVVGYDDQEGCVDSPYLAAAAALALTNDAGCQKTTWFVFDRKTGTMRELYQRDFADLRVP